MTVAELAIGGMTCASCAARVEKKLNRLDGVSATVNFATETARVTFPAALPAETWSRWSSRPATPRCCSAARGRARGHPAQEAPPRSPLASCRWSWPSRWWCWR